MIITDTVFILGAGASVPYGYPTVAELRKYICYDFRTQVKRMISKIKLPSKQAVWQGEVDQLCKIFRKSSIPSIDLFLSRNPKLVDIGKIAIISSIFNYEHNSKFREESPIPNQDWYSHLFNVMTNTLIEPDSYRRFGNNNVTFITFNYDRSLEHFLYESLINSFSEAPEEEIIEEITKIPIYHVYGRINNMPWEQKNNPEGVDYLTNTESPYDRFSLERLQQWSSSIRIIQERSK